MPLPTVTNVTSTSFTVSWTDPCFDQSTSYKVCYRAEEEDNWNELVVDGNGGPRYQVKIDGLKGNQGYEVKVIAVGGKGESSWWGGEEVKDCWTMGGFCDLRGRSSDNLACESHAPTFALATPQASPNNPSLPT